MKDEGILVLSTMATPGLNEHRRTLATCIADLKAAQQNLNLLVQQNTLDKTPYLLSGEDTSKQERLHAARMAVEALDRVRAVIDTLPR
jgi:pyruvate dehydrogenase complex dehydrogenase (E1) component